MRGPCSPWRRRLPVVLPLLVLLIPSASLDGQEVRVTVSDAGVRLESAEVILRTSGGDLVGWGITGPGGSVALPVPGGGRFLLQVRRLGYGELTDREVEIASAGATAVSVELRPEALQLEGITVEAERRRRRLDALGFYRRQESWPGVFYDRAQIDSLRPRGMDDLLRRIPFVLFRWDENGRRYPVFRGGQAGLTRICFPVVFLDGQAVGGGREAFDVASIVHPDEIDAVEFYSGAASVPSRFNTSDTGCGVIAVWTS